ncbi:MAG TPA: glycosyltransferase family 1 protein [Chitinophagaceae bacterium]|nr:glycosyltransferase family 1 protein [Chitinophagaceae bacterium]
MPKLVRMTTVPVSLQFLLRGQMRFMKEQGFDVTMISSDGPELGPLIAQEGCPHISVTLTRKITPWQDLKSLIRLARIFRKIKPDIVHTHTPKAGLIGMWAAMFAAVPVRLHTIAGLPWMESSGLMRFVLKTVEKLTALPAHKVYPNSKALLQYLQQQGIARNKMKVLGSGSSNGINSSFFSRSPELESAAAALKNEAGLKGQGMVWIFIGRLVRDKGMGELLDSFSSIHKRYPDDQLWLLGNEEQDLDPLDEHHRKLLHEHPAVRCWGFQPDVRPYLAAAEVLVFPSYREGFPNVPMQAGAMGCALILSDINGCNEIVDHGTNGLLVPVKQMQALEQAMEQLRADAQLRHRLASAIREKIVTRFDQETLWHIILAEYQELLQGGKKH